MRARVHPYESPITFGSIRWKFDSFGIESLLFAFDELRCNPTRHQLATQSSDLVVHRNVVLMLCDNAAVLEEVLLNIDESTWHLERVSDRAIVAPADRLEALLETLHDQGTFPRVVGKPRPPEMEGEEADETEGEEGDK